MADWHEISGERRKCFCPSQAEGFSVDWDTVAHYVYMYIFVYIYVIYVHTYIYIHTHHIHTHICIFIY